MAESPSTLVDRIRARNIFALTGASIALSTLIFFFPSNASVYSIDFGPPVSLLTIIYHTTILILSRRHRESPNPSPYYPTRRPAVGLAAFLFLVWLITMGYMIISLALFFQRDWGWDVRFFISLWAQFILTVVETGVMLAITLVCTSARQPRSR